MGFDRRRMGQRQRFPLRLKTAIVGSGARADFQNVPDVGRGGQLAAVEQLVDL